MTKRILVTLAFASALVLPATAAMAQVIPTPVVVTANTDPVNNWYRAQQYLHEAQQASSDYQAFQIALQNIQHGGGVAALVNVVNPLTALQHDINLAMNNNTDPHLAAELRQNQFLNQDLSAIAQFKAIVDNPGAGNAQMMQAADSLLTYLSASNMRAATLNYAQAQDEVRRANNQAAIDAANYADGLRP